MNERVAIIGVGMTAARPATEHLSFKEMMFEAAQKAYADAGVEAREIESFVTCAEDLSEGISIFDEYTPDQLGALQKPVHTLTQDGLHGIADAVMQLRSGLAGLVVVEAHSKHSNLENPDSILDYALDPVYNRPLGFTPHVIAGLEMNVFLHERGITQAQCARVVAKNRTHALKNMAAAYPMNLRAEDVESSPYFCYPLREAEMAKSADGCVVMVLASESGSKAGRGGSGCAASVLQTTVLLWNRATGSTRNTFGAPRPWLTVRPASKIRLPRSIFSRSTTAMRIRSCSI